MVALRHKQVRTDTRSHDIGFSRLGGEPQGVLDGIK